MKIALAPLIVVLIGIAVLPALLAGGDPPTLNACTPATGSVAMILATIRQLESGGDYHAQATGSTASGAYQFLDSSWAGYRGYLHAKDAPPAVQDAKAAEHVQSILDSNSGDVSAVPVAWYIGHLPAADSTEWDTIPAPETGNRITPRQYQAKWMATYQDLLNLTDGAADLTTSTSAPTDLNTSTCYGGSDRPPGPDGPTNGDWALPLPRDLLSVSALHNPHHHYPAIDLLVPEGTPVYALTDGTVVRVTNFAHNWWADGCPHPGCDPCGVGASVAAANGLRYIYCHGQQSYVQVGDHVTPGQHLLDSGNNGNSGAPHLHLELKINGSQRCPQPLLEALYVDAPPTDVAELSSAGCTF